MHIMYLRLLKLKQFENSEETAEFILKINMLDIPHFKSKFVKPYKSPITLDNIDGLSSWYLYETMFYLKGVIWQWN